MRYPHTFLPEQLHLFSANLGQLLDFFLHLVNRTDAKKSTPARLLKDQVATVPCHVTMEILDLNLGPSTPTHGSPRPHLAWSTRASRHSEPDNPAFISNRWATSDFSDCLPPVTCSSFHQPPAWWQPGSYKLFYCLLFANINARDRWPLCQHFPFFL